MERSAASPLTTWDALIVEAAEACGASVLYTEAKHLLSLSAGVDIADPFSGLAERASA